MIVRHKTARHWPAPPADADAGGDVIAAVRAAVAARRAALAFQPVVQAGAPHRIAFHEGLIRLSDLNGRLMPAAAFIEQVEGQALGREIDALALDLGLAALRDHPGLRLSVNMSVHSIGDPRWSETLRRGLAADPTVGERLILEITETSAMGRPERVAAFMHAVQGCGVAFALDDFGAGATSFRYLREFRFDIVKIDGQFIGGLAYDRDNQVLLGAMVDIARHFDMLTVAEKVETAADAAACAESGIGCLQGYHFGAPQLCPDWDSIARLKA